MASSYSIPQIPSKREKAKPRSSLASHLASHEPALSTFQSRSSKLGPRILQALPDLNPAGQDLLRRQHEPVSRVPELDAPAKLRLADIRQVISAVSAGLVQHHCRSENAARSVNHCQMGNRAGGETGIDERQRGG